jgi:hypothetical protein
VAMTLHEPTGPDPASSASTDPGLEAVAQALRQHTDARWVEISDRVRSRALQSTRGSLPVRAQAPGGPVRVSEQVLISYLRDALANVPGSRVQDITVSTEGVDTYVGLGLYISARYGSPLLPIADRLRTLAASRLGELLGTIAPPPTVTTMHVHVEQIYDDDLDDRP